MPSVSVIVPVYNVEMFLERCILSVLRQTCQDYELILVDDGSPDKCPIICERFAQFESKIVVIHKTNGGLSSARNAGIAIARGKYIVFVDSDDFIALNMLEIMTEIIGDTNADAVISTHYARATLESNSSMFSKRDCTVETMLPCDALEKIFCENARWEAWGNLYKRKLFEKNRYIEGKIYEDFEITPRLLLSADSIAFFHGVVSYYQINNNSIMFKSRVVIKTDLLDHIKSMLSIVSKSDMPSTKRKDILAGILMEFMSRVNLAEKNRTANAFFIKHGRKILRKNLTTFWNANKYTLKNKVYYTTEAMGLGFLWTVVNQIKNRFKNGRQEHKS